MLIPRQLHVYMYVFRFRKSSNGKSKSRNNFDLPPSHEMEKSAQENDGIYKQVESYGVYHTDPDMDHQYANPVDDGVISGETGFSNQGYQ